MDINPIHAAMAALLLSLVLVLLFTRYDDGKP